MAEGEPLGLEPQAGSKTPASGTVSASFRREIRGLGGVEGGSLIEELDEEVAAPAEIAMGAGLALRFGKAPCVTMDTMGRDEVERLVAPYCRQYGAEVPASLARVGRLVG